MAAHGKAHTPSTPASTTGFSRSKVGWTLGGVAIALVILGIVLAYNKDKSGMTPASGVPSGSPTPVAQAPAAPSEPMLAPKGDEKAWRRIQKFQPTGQIVEFRAMLENEDGQATFEHTARPGNVPTEAVVTWNVASGDGRQYLMDNVGQYDSVHVEADGSNYIVTRNGDGARYVYTREGVDKAKIAERYGL